MAAKDLINVIELQKLQDEFSYVTGTCVYCLDAQLNRLTKLSGKADEQLLAGRFIGSTAVSSALSRVEEGSLEDTAVEYLERGQGMVAASRIDVDRKPVLYWVIIALGEGVNEIRLEQRVDLLGDFSRAFYHERMLARNNEMQARYSYAEKLQAEEYAGLVEANAAIVRLFDDEDSIEKVLHNWLGIVCNYLHMDTAQVFKIYQDGELMDIMVEWRREGIVSYFDRHSRLKASRSVVWDKSQVNSSDKIAEINLMHGSEVKANMVFPLLRSGEYTGMVVFFNKRSVHNFTSSEVFFATDAVKVMQNIIKQRLQKDSLASSYQSLEGLLDNIGSCIYVEAEDGHPLFANKKLKTTFAKELKDSTFDTVLAIGGNTEEGTSREIYHGDRDKWYDFFTKEITWMDQSKARLYTLHDVTEKKMYQRRIEQQAYTDFLTGLYNRMCCERDLARLVDEAKRNKTVGALLYMDLDDFKHINDALGHQYGDALLKAISHSLLRIDGIQENCYRMGGDEFVILVSPEVFPRFDSILDDIKKIFARPWFLKDTDYYCTMSMGIVQFPDAGDSVVDLVKKADISMYEAKKGGKNRIAWYSDNLDTSSGRRLDMEKNMRDAATEGCDEFEVYYQPIINVLDGEVCAGAEALIRWNSSKLGFIPPAEFIPLAEYLGLINPIGNHVLHEACKRCKMWNDSGKEYKVNVNLSVVQLLQPDIVKIVADILKETQLNPAHLTLEVTESLAINDMERMKGILAAIKELGVKIALDDFGTGYSSLNHIREIPFDVIKVDQSFVKDLAESAYAKSFVKMVAELAEAIGVNVCVEGIETGDQYDVLQGMRVKYIQGYYFDKPLTKEAFEEKYLK